jgi:hypothetical protein
MTPMNRSRRVAISVLLLLCAGMPLAAQAAAPHERLRALMLSALNH